MPSKTKASLNSPFVRIVIPAFHSAGMIREVVSAALRSEGRFRLQVVVVDDGGNGDLQARLRGLPVTVVSTGGSGSAAIARNRGAQGFEGDYLVFIDSDVIVHRPCVDTLLAPLREGRADATVGNYSDMVAGLPFAARYKQLYIARIYRRQAGPLRNEFWTAIGAMDARVFRRLRGFDPAFSGAGGEDTELGRRLTEGGFTTLAVPAALGDHRHPLSVTQLLENDWRKGLLAMGNYFESRGSLSHNRHATRRDMLAAATATLTLALLPSLLLRPSPLVAGLAFALLLAVYLTSRADLLRVFRSQGAAFVAGAGALLFVLDLMRAFCFALGVLHRLTGRIPLPASVLQPLTPAPSEPYAGVNYLEKNL